MRAERKKSLGTSVNFPAFQESLPPDDTTGQHLWLDVATDVPAGPHDAVLLIKHHEDEYQCDERSDRQHEVEFELGAGTDDQGDSRDAHAENPDHPFPKSENLDPQRLVLSKEKFAIFLADIRLDPLLRNIPHCLVPRSAPAAAPKTITKRYRAERQALRRPDNEGSVIREVNGRDS